MAFNKKEYLKKNIEALQLVFQLDNENRHANETQREILMRHSGFSILKFVINLADKPEEINRWVKSEQDLVPLAQELHQLLRENSEDEKQYHRYVECIKFCSDCFLYPSFSY